MEAGQEGGEVDENSTVKAEEHEVMKGKHRSEFRYRTFVRSISLPEGADEEHIQATFDNGVLEVTVSPKDKRTRSRSCGFR
jgi:HSP20 family protein